MYITDCVEGIHLLMRGDHPEPLNLGTDVLVTIDALVDLVAEVAGECVRKRYDVSRPQGVRGRNSDNTRLKEVLQWEPAVSLREGSALTYQWIEEELRKAGRLPRPVPASPEQPAAETSRAVSG